MRFALPILTHALVHSLESVEAHDYNAPLPGLHTKPHLKGLKRSDLALDMLFPYASADKNGKKYPKHLNESQPSEEERAEIQQLKKDTIEKEQKKRQSKENLNQTSKEADQLLKSRKHPQVQGSAAFCSRSVDRLKRGPVNIPELQCTNTQYSDLEFFESGQIWWTDYNSYSSYSSYQSLLNSNYFYFADWRNIYPSADILDPDGSISYNEAIQGSAGTCYMIASLASVGEFPQIVRDVFVTESKNDVGAIMVRFYIRGKPWLVSIDNQFLFKYTSSPEAVFAKVANDEKSMWAAILEKAWAKVKGNYLIADGGLSENGLHALTGVPVFRYETEDITTDAMVESTFQQLKAADAAGYIMNAGTKGNGNDQENNVCGIAMSHAYSILAAFEMTDAAGTVHKCLLVRNPWGVSYYNQEWNKDDPNWTDALVAQVPWQVDVRTKQASEGLFVVPIAKLKGDDCFADYQIAHNRDAEGYSDVWFDKINAGENVYYDYYYDTDPSNPSDLYISVATYGHAIIPNSCTTGTLSTGQSSYYPVAYIAVYDASNTKLDSKFYMDQFAKPILISQAQAVGTLRLRVNYEFLGSPHPDFTLKVYAKSNNPIKDGNGQTSMIYMDGQQPSGFTESTYTGMNNWVCQAPNDPPVEEEEKDVKDIPVKSLTDVFIQAENFQEFVTFLWYNPWVAFVWFHFW